MTTQQTWAQSPAPVTTPAPTSAATDFGSTPPPAFGDAPGAMPIPSAPVIDDPDRPLRRVKK